MERGGERRTLTVTLGTPPDQHTRDDRDRLNATRGDRRRDTDERRLRALDADEEPSPAREAHDALETALFEIKRVIVGQEAMLERVLVALLAGGHVLLEGVPGLAKTLTVKTVADVLGGSFKRLQFTPGPRARRPRRHADLPAGHRRASTPSSARCSATSCSRTRSTARPPRCSPRCSRSCRSARSRSATRRHRVPAPFLVMATQNPIESEGTYPLPEAQVDRFMFKLVVDYPTTRDEVAVVERSLDGGARVREVLSPESLARPPARGGARVYVDRRVMEYAVALTTATREPRRGRLGRVRRQPARLDQPGPRRPRAGAAARRATTCCRSTCATSRATCCATGSCSPTRRWPPAWTPTACSTTCSSASPMPRIELAHERGATAALAARMSFREPLAAGRARARCPLALAAYVAAQRRRRRFAVRYTNVDVLAAVAAARRGCATCRRCWRCSRSRRCWSRWRGPSARSRPSARRRR